MNEGCLEVKEIAKIVGESMLDYHLHRLELAGLIDVKEGRIVLTESGVAYGELVKSQDYLERPSTKAFKSLRTLKNWTYLKGSVSPEPGEKRPKSKT